MSMRKDREITIIRESVTKSSRPVGRLSMSLVEALFDENYDVSSIGSLNEERHKAPGYTKKDQKFLDQYSVVRDLAKSMKPSEDQKFPIDIPGVPDKKIRIVTNRNGIPRAYTDKSNYDEVRDWRLKSNNTDHDKPIIEITPDTQPAEQPNSRDADVDAQNADDAATRQAAEDERVRQLEDLPGESNEDKLKSLLPEFTEIAENSDLTPNAKLNKWLETYNKALDLSGSDDADAHKPEVAALIKTLQTDRDSIMGGGLDDAGSDFNTKLNSLKKFLDQTVAGDSLKSIVKGSMDTGEGPPLRDQEGQETDVDFEPQGDVGPVPDRFREEEESRGDSTPTEGERVPDGNQDSDGAGDDEEQPGGGGGGGQPPPPPTGDAKAVSDYIDQVAAGAQTVDLSEIRRPLHKRSLVELLYSS